MWAGEFNVAAPRFSLGVVDVRDVAAAHTIAAFNPKASGRHITSAESFWVNDLVGLAAEAAPGRIKRPRFAPPKWLLWLVAPLAKMRRDIVRCVLLHSNAALISTLAERALVGSGCT